MDDSPSASPRHTLSKRERLHGKKDLDTLFRSGRALRVPPFRLLWASAVNDGTPVRVAFAVPKKNLKRATDRNLMKRRMREAYRKHKLPVQNSMAEAGAEAAVVFIFTGREAVPYNETEGKIILLLQRFTDSVCGKS
jgi:ribonuclease P protein component